MQSTPGDRQPLENEGLKAGQHGREAVSITSHTACIGPSNTYSGSGFEKRVCLCVHTGVHGFVGPFNVCAVSGMGLSVDDERQ